MNRRELVFGLPTQRTVKEEKYPDQGVLKFHSQAGNVKSKVEKNLFLINRLGLKLDGNDYVNFEFLTNKIYFANTTDIENPTNIRVTKTGTFSNKKICDFILSKFDMDINKDNELLVTEIEDKVGTVELLLDSVYETPATSNDSVTQVLEDVSLIGDSEPMRVTSVIPEPTQN
jgi:hypothetical protein